MCQNSKTQNKKKFNKKNYNCDQTLHLNFDNTQILKLWQNSKTKIVTKLKKSNWDKTKKKNNDSSDSIDNCSSSIYFFIISISKLKKKTQQISDCDQNPKTLIVTKQKNEIVTKLKKT